MDWHMVARAGSGALALVGVAFTAAGCSVFDASLLPDERVCEGKQPPARVDGVGVDDPVGEEYIVVLRDILVKQYEGAADAPWRNIGFNLDGYCTSATDIRGECTLPPGSALQLDGESGIDNTFGASFFRLLEASVPGIDEDLIATEARGVGAIVLLIRGWNGERDDAEVSVVVTQSVAGTTASPTDVVVRGSELFLQDNNLPAPPPQWDGTDYFWARDDTFVGGDLSLATARDDTAYVTDGVVVARLPDRTPISLVGENVGVVVTLADLVAAGNIYELFFEEPETPPTVVVSGRWSFVDLVGQARNVNLCPGPVFDGITEYLSTILDVRDNRSVDPDPGLPCNALSVAVTFRAYQGRFGGLAEGQIPVDRCPP